MSACDQSRHINEPQWAFGQTIDQSAGVESCRCRFLLQTVLPVDYRLNVVNQFGD
jgi:hypothetical protein